MQKRIYFNYIKNSTLFRRKGSMDKLNVKTRNVERSDEIDSRLVDKIEGFRSDVDKKVRDLSEAYSESGNDDEKNLIAYRISALKCDIPEIMDFVRAYNKGLAERIEQIDIENRIVEVEHHQNANGKADIGADNASGADNKPTDEDQQRLECSKNIKESADIGINNASDSDDESAEEQRRRNAAAKKLGDMLSKINWANIKFDEEVARFEKLDPKDIRRAINSDKINGLKLLFLRYVLGEIHNNRDTNNRRRVYLANQLKKELEMMPKLIKTLANFTEGVSLIQEEKGKYSERTDHEKDVEKKAKELYGKAKKMAREIHNINEYLLLIGRYNDKDGKVSVPKDICGFLKSIEIFGGTPGNCVVINKSDGRPFINEKDALEAVDEEIELLNGVLNRGEDLLKYSQQHREILNKIAQMSKMLASI